MCVHYEPKSNIECTRTHLYSFPWLDYIRYLPRKEAKGVCVHLHQAKAKDKMADQDMDAQWAEYKAKFNKVYEPEEDKMRRDIWEKTLQKIETHNKEADEGKHTWRMGINHLTDKRPDEVCCGGLRQCHRPNQEEDGGH